ncbi:MAG: nucleotidyl transferase AbiEii/AbiGii toxin family protein [Planctomycetota bacterium]|nr:nucleotidyl transferase AbiEii/AbiGii toxin family protein [Planctomycetota bacterium]
MLDFAKLPPAARIPYFQEVANRRGLTRLIVEKDFWVCVALRLLFAVPELAGKFVFKGGTSLSKVFDIIKRFDVAETLDARRTFRGVGSRRR